MTDDPPSPGPGLRRAAAGRCSPASPARRSPPPRTATATPAPTPSRSPHWFSRDPGRNLAIATGVPGPDVLDVDQHGPAGNGFTALGQLRDAGLLDGAAAYVRTPSGGMHVYFTGTPQHCGHLPAHHLDFRSTGGYVLAPPSQVGGKPYRLVWEPGGRGGTLNWERAARAPATPAAAPARTAGPAPVLISGTWPAGSPPARRQPQRRPVLGRQPRPGGRPRRRPEPAGRRRPPGRPGRPGNHPDPGLRPPHRPGPPRAAGYEPEAVMKMSINPPAGPVPGQPGPPYPAAGPGPARAHVRRLRQDGRTYRAIAAAAGLDRATVSDLARGRRRPNRGTTSRGAGRDQPGRPARPRRRRRDPAAAAGPARDGPRLGPHRPRPRRPRADHPADRPRRRPHRQPRAPRQGHRPVRRLVGQARPRPHPRSTAPRPPPPASAPSPGTGAPPPPSTTTCSTSPATGPARAGNPPPAPASPPTSGRAARRRRRDRR